ncbi:interferon-induced protein 44-like [Elgaria multicarinata webbii]|uniref:interferon-induced protein 44-like n=1 Tax=Elgaria multicarinata webbii TaxID=159646 RepID=UPI002FCD5CB8
MADGKSRLTQEKKKVLLQLLRCESLSLLYKATVHGYHVNTFHAICNKQGPTVVVAYNKSGYIYGGFTAQSYSSSGQYLQDEKAFLFRLKGKKKEPLKIPFKSASRAVNDTPSYGPNFGDGALIFLYQNSSAVFTNPNIANYTFCAGDLHGNDNTLLECEVYRVEGLGALLENPLRKVEWTAGQREKLMDEIRTFKPSLNSVPKLRVLLLGTVGAGKSSFFNSVNSAFQGYVASDALAGSDSTSVTMQYRTYEVETADGKPLSIVFCDTMGLEEKEGAGLNIDELPSLLKGHVPDRYQFNPCAILNPNAPDYIKSPSLKDQIHCVVLIIDGSKVEILPEKLEAKLRKIRKETSEVPLLVIITKVDEVCSALAEDVSDVYRSKAVVEQMQLTGEKLGIPLCQIVPVKNYSSEIEIKDDVDILLLMAVRQMLRLTKGYFKSLPLAKGN